MRVRVRLRVWVWGGDRVRSGVWVRVRVRVRVTVRLVIKPIPLSRYTLARKGILFGGPAKDKSLDTRINKEHTHYQEITLGFSF